MSDFNTPLSFFTLIFNSLLTFLFLNYYVYALPSTTIATGRPGQSIGANVVGESVLQIQSGIENNTIEKGPSTTHTTYINNVVRYGFSDYFEVSSLFDFNSVNKSSSSIGNFQLGGRLSLNEKADGIIPKLCVQTRIQLYNSQGDKVSKFKHVTIFSSVFDLAELGSLTSNINFSNVGINSTDLSAFTLAWGKNLSQNLSYFFEYYTIANGTQFENYFDTGFGYNINSDTLFDISFGKDIESSLSSRFISVGISWRKI